MPEITVHSATIHYDAAGPASPALTVVFFHGAGGSTYAWKDILASPAPDCRYLAIDLPGHGGSAGPGRTSMEDYAAAARSIVDALVAGPYVLAGHSMGGAIVQLAALTRPPGLRGIILVGTGARLRVAPAVFEGLQGDFRAAMEFSAPMSFSAAAAPDIIQGYIQETVRGAAEVMIGDFRACDAFDTMARVAEVAVPALILCGEDDTMTPVKYSRYLHDRIAGSRLEIIPGAGHMVPLEKPREVSGHIASFLDTLRARTP